MSLTFFAPAFGRAFRLSGKEDQPQGPGKDKDIRQVVDEGVVDAAAGVVQEIEHIAVDQPVRHIRQRPADQQATAELRPTPMRAAPEP